ncbi:MAG: DUF2182 domain-containing protein [Paucibacter sp.]|nr:DUF2182 domain-containing protein [Roseateles sp.]
MRPLASLLRQQRLWLVLALAAIVALAWAYVWQGVGMGMPASDMTAALLFPHRAAETPGSMVVAWPLLLSMWWMMMVAMMAPAALPLLLLYRRAVLHHAPCGSVAAISLAGLLLGYLASWGAFAVLATVAQGLLQPAGLLSGAMWWSRSRVFSAALLIVAGVYQWTPLKNRCLNHCRDPVRFLVDSRAGPGFAAALRLGLRHGAYCVGCCGPLMALLFVGGVMNLLWMAALCVLVLFEKLLPQGPRVARGLGVALVSWGMATLLV